MAKETLGQWLGWLAGEQVQVSVNVVVSAGKYANGGEIEAMFLWRIFLRDFSLFCIFLKAQFSIVVLFGANLNP